MFLCCFHLEIYVYVKKTRPLPCNVVLCVGEGAINALLVWY